MTDRDRIALRGMLFLARHGVTLEERMEPQPIEVDVELETDLDRASASDEIADTIDYSAVFTLAARIVEDQSFRLIEALAGTIADAVLESTGARRVEVRVRKPRAPLPGPFQSVEVTVARPKGA